MQANYHDTISPILRSSLALSTGCLLLVPGCGFGVLDELADVPVCDTPYTDPECLDTTTLSSDAATETTSTDAPGVATVTSAANDATGETSGDATGGDATGPTSEPLPPAPVVVKPTIDPTTIMVEGDLHVDVTTQHALGLRMSIDAGPPVDLAPMGADLFVATIPVYSGLANGTHPVIFTAYAGDQTSAPFPAEYTVNLPTPGSEALWDASGEVGPGFAAGVVVHGGHAFEFGSFEIGGKNRCYLRRRSPAGTYGPTDIRMLAQDEACTAKAVAADADGAIYFLATREFNGDPRWWLGRIDTWEGETINVGWGAPGEQAHALAARPGTTEVAICGTAPAPDTDLLDTKVVIFRKDGPGLSPTPYDYVPSPDDPVHQFKETARDCVYRGATLAVFGEAYGPHEGLNNAKRSRLSIFSIDTNTGTGVWKILEKEGLHTQSGAWGGTVDEDGSYYTVGYVCGDVCTPQLQLRRFDAGGGPGGWAVFPDIAATKAADIAWSPAGYLLVASGAAQGDWWTNFWIQAWQPDTTTPAWTYGRSDAPTFHVALGVAAGPQGRVYAVGFAVQDDQSMPVFAVLNP